jgi:hypothetical protein
MSKILNKIRSVCFEQFKGKFSEEEAFRKIKEILYDGNKLTVSYYGGVDFAKSISIIDTPLS